MMLLMRDTAKAKRLDFFIDADGGNNGGDATAIWVSYCAVWGNHHGLSAAKDL